MFECLSKMVKIKNDVLYTVDPFAYTKLSKTVKPIDTSEKNALTLPVCNEIVCLILLINC